MKTRRGWIPEIETMTFGQGMCAADKGYVQCETGQDAPYYGIWVNPTELKIFSYCEGDCSLEEAESKEEFCERMRSVKKWHVEHYKVWFMFTEAHAEIHQAFLDLGLADVIEDVGGGDANND